MLMGLVRAGNALLSGFSITLHYRLKHYHRSGQEWASLLCGCVATAVPHWPDPAGHLNFFAPCWLVLCFHCNYIVRLIVFPFSLPFFLGERLCNV